MQGLCLAVADQFELSRGARFTAIKPEGAKSEAIHLRGKGRRWTVDPPRPAQAKPAAMAAVAARSGCQAVFGQRDGHAAFDHLERYRCVVMHSEGVRARPIAVWMCAAAADLNFDQHLSRAVGLDGLKRADVTDGVVGRRQSVRNGFCKRAEQNVEQNMAGRQAMGDGRGVLRRDDQAFGGHDFDRPVAPGVWNDRTIGGGNDSEVDRG